MIKTLIAVSALLAGLSACGGSSLPPVHPSPSPSPHTIYIPPSLRMIV